MAQTAPKKTILLVEDEAVIAMNEAMILKDHGFDVISVRSGEKAVETVKNHSVDMILMDIDLGNGMDGTASAKIILQERQIPIVFLSSHTEPEIVDKTEKITSFGYVVKNSGETVLIASIRMAFRLFEANREREEKNLQLETLFNNVPDLIGRLDRNKKHLYVNQALCDFMGIPSDDYIGKTIDELGAPEHLSQKWNDAVDKAFETGKETEVEISVGEGASLLTIESKIVPEIVEQGNVTTVITISRDITERKRNEDLLREQEQYLQSIFNGIGIAVFVVDVAKKRFCFSKLNRLYKIIIDRFGIKDFTGKYLDELYHTLPPGILDTAKKNFIRCVETGGEIEYEAPGPFIDGVQTYFLTRLSPMKDAGGRVYRIIGSTMDITSRVQSEKKLKLSEERCRIISSISADYAYCNRLIREGSLEPVWHIGSFDHITGYTPEELYQLGGWSSLIHPDDIPKAKEYVEKLLAGDEASITARIITKSGEHRWIQDRGKPWMDEKSGRVIGTYGAAVDVTERKKLEKESRISEERFRKIFETEDVAIALSRAEDGIYLEANPGFIKITGYSYDEIIGKSSRELNFMSDSYRRNLAAGLKKYGFLKNQELTYPTKSGEQKTILFCISPINLDNTQCFLAVMTDITERNNVLREKEVLMQELNHRVKNNLLMISSLISLKNTSLGSIADLSDLIHQVDAIRIIHEKLYQSDNITKINLRDYLNDLFKTLFSFSPKKVELKSSVGIEKIKTRTAIPVGLIINEVATNAVKHGFTETDNPVFSITLKKADGQFILYLSNTGKPFPEDIDLDNPETLGLRLISALVKQLDGTMHLVRKPHPVYTIRFPENKG